MKITYETNEQGESVRVTTYPTGAVTRELVSAPPAEAPPHRIFTPLGFRRLFTIDERAAIEWAAVDRADQTLRQRQGAAALRASLKDQESAEYIDLGDLDTVAGINKLALFGLLTPERAAEILAAQPADFSPQ